MQSMRTGQIGQAATTALLVVTCLVLSTLAFGLVTQRFRVLPVLTGSMEPMIGAGDMAVATAKPLDQVRVGDVLVYHPPGDERLIVHRVVDLTEGDLGPTIRTKGDDNDVIDPWTAELQGDVAWQVKRVVPKIGHLAVLAKRPNVRLLAIGLAAIVFLFVTVQSIWREKDFDEEVVGDAVALA
ncbi:MAG: signal peptidase I [Actinobacteria bacterium]|nr:signal peptidase I [Actinomycetota bacterium]